MYTYLYIYIYIYIYIHIYIYIREHECPNRGDIPGSGGTFFDLGIVFIHKTALGSASCDGSHGQVRTQQSRASGAVYLVRCGFFCDP